MLYAQRVRDENVIEGAFGNADRDRSPATLWH